MKTWGYPLKFCCKKQGVGLLLKNIAEARNTRPLPKAFCWLITQSPLDGPGMCNQTCFLSAATMALPSAIQTAVIDYDQLLTGQRREGRYIGLWSIAIISFYAISEEKHIQIRREIAHRVHSP